MTANLHSYLQTADLPNYFTMHSFRVEGSLSKSLAGTAVDEIMKMVADIQSQLRSTTSGLPGSSTLRVPAKNGYPPIV